VASKVRGQGRRQNAGDCSALAEVVGNGRILAELYPRHVEKEDRHFFIPCMQYFSSEEKNGMLAKEREFDLTLIHQLYKEKVNQAEKGQASVLPFRKKAS
jgi:hemerythrin-like domain-containing protein